MERQMEIVVQKFGGSSLGTEAGRQAAARHVTAAVSDQAAVVVVVSAMGRGGDAYATDTLLSVVDPTNASARDLDVLMACGEAISAVTFASLLREHGHGVTVLSGQQAGILTDDEHGDAQILEIRPQRILTELQRGNVVVVMGFQGATVAGDITTLGRGGSDTSATALAAALDAQVVDIFTDVDGIMTADPRVVPDARCIRQASYVAVCQLAKHGAKVLHPAAVEYAMAQQIPIRVRNTYSDDVGTLIADFGDGDTGGVTSMGETWYIEFASSHAAQSAGQQSGGLLGHSDLVHIRDGALVMTPVNQHRQNVAGLLQNWSSHACSIRRCAKVAVIFSDSAGEPRAHEHRVRVALQNLGISVAFCETSTHALWCLIEPEFVSDAVNALHREFGLGETARAVLTS